MDGSFDNYNLFRLLTIQNFRKKAQTQMFDGHLNTHLRTYVTFQLLCNGNSTDRWEA